MRLTLIYAALLAGVASWGATVNPSAVQQAIAPAMEAVDRFFSDKEIEIHGNELLDAATIAALLPRDKSNIWWRLHRPALAAALQANPLIKSAEVKPCSRISFRCFEVSIIEREPAYIAQDATGREFWVVGLDGKLITRVPPSKSRQLSVEELAHDLGGLIIFWGAFKPGLSPDLIQHRLEALAQIADTVAETTGLTLRALRINDNDEVEGIFLELRAVVIFGQVDAGVEYIRLHSRRLRALVDELGIDRAAEAKLIDLSYEKLGVLRTSE